MWEWVPDAAEKVGTRARGEEDSSLPAVGGLGARSGAPGEISA